MDILKQPNTVFHCPTEELSKKFCKLLHDKGFKWATRDSYLDLIKWDKYKYDTAYKPDTGQYCNVDYYKKYKYNIIKITPSFFKSNLKLKTFLL